ncbi:MAG: hypothetical protein AB7G47_20230 [Mycolicibacterium sp.]|uniref:hypothetical protein n=1 Tax=Mycolicibacterium sp. TaxID=2320850 RepID=UPI003D0CAEF8
MTAALASSFDDLMMSTATRPPLWEPEDQFVGALLHMGARHRAERQALIELVPATALVRPITRWAYELISELSRRGIDPDPTLVLTAARRQPPAAEADTRPDLTTTALRPNVLGELGGYLADVYTQSYADANPRHYAQEILDDAFRRAAGAWGARLQYMADAYADRQDITTIITDIMRGELRELWQRAERAGRTTTDNEGREH